MRALALLRVRQSRLDAGAGGVTKSRCEIEWIQEEEELHGK